MNKISKLIYTLCSLSILTLSVSSCIGNKNSTDSSTISNGGLKASLTSVSGANFVKVHDQFQNTGDIQPQCFESSFCVSYSNEFGATYRIGRDDYPHWISQVEPVSLKVIFKNAVPSDFHLANINQDTANGDIVGKVSGIDDSDCNDLVAGKKQGHICKIKFMYQGIKMSTQVNTIHFTFGWDKGQKIMDYSINFNNSPAEASTVVPLADFASEQTPLFINLPLSETPSHDGLYYPDSDDKQIQIVNRSTVDLNPHILPDDNNKFLTMSIQLGSFFNSYLTNDQLIYGNINETSCGANSLLADSSSSCYFPFMLNDEGKLSSSYGMLSVTYYADDSTNITMGREFVISRGDLSLNDIQPIMLMREGQNSGQLTVNRDNSTGPAGIAYSVPISDLTFYAKYDPKLDLANSVYDNKLVYAFGDYGQQNNIQKLIDNLNITPDDPNCFTSHADQKYETSLDLTARQCKINFANIGDVSSKPFGFQLYASYTSNGKKIDQLLGTITIAKQQYGAMPGGTYHSSFQNVQYKNGILTGLMDNALPFMSSLDYFDSCEPGSTVGVLNFYQHSMKWNSLEFLHCDQWASKFPKGSYQKSCINLKIDNSTLSASCITQNADRDNVLQNSTLDTSKCPANGDITIDSLGNLQCSQ